LAESRLKKQNESVLNMPECYTPLVSIIIPVYNGANYLEHAINSALVQTYPNCEIIVVNDGSTDDGATERVALTYGDRIRYIWKENGKTASALNCGIAHMRGKYFSWLSHDDLYKPQKVAEQVKLAEDHGGEAVIVCNIAQIDSLGNRMKTNRISEHFSRSVRCYLALDVATGINGCALLIPKKLLDEVGPFRLDKRITQDYLKWFQMAESAEFVLLDEELVLSRIHPDQDSRRLTDVVLDECDDLHSGFLRQISGKEITKFIGNDIAYFANSLYVYHVSGYRKTAWEIIKHAKNVHGLSEAKQVHDKLYSIVFGEELHDSFENIAPFLSQLEDKPNKSKPRILVYSNVWVKGGLERVVSATISYLREHFTIFLAHGRNPPDIDITGSFPLPEDVLKIVLPNNIGPEVPQRLTLLAALLQVDVFLGCPNTDVNFLPVYQCMKEAGIRSIAWNHGNYFLVYAYDWLLPVAKRRSEALSYSDASAWVSSYSAQAYAMREQNAAVMPNPNPLSWMTSSSPREKRGKDILCVGRFYDAVKRIDMALHVFREVLRAHPDSRLILVGGYRLDIAVPAGGPTTVFQTLQELHFPEGSVVFEGEKEDVASYYQSAQLLMHTSETEGFGLCLVEASFFGLPIVAWDLPVYGDLLDHGNNALLAPYFDTYAMAQSVNRLLADPALCRTMGMNGREISTRFEAKRSADRWKDLIDGVLASSSTSETREMLRQRFAPPEPNNKAIRGLAADYEQALTRLGNRIIELASHQPSSVAVPEPAPPVAAPELRSLGKTILSYRQSGLQVTVSDNRGSNWMRFVVNLKAILRHPFKRNRRREYRRTQTMLRKKNSPAHPPLDLIQGAEGLEERGSNWMRFVVNLKAILRHPFKRNRRREYRRTQTMLRRKNSPAQPPLDLTQGAEGLEEIATFMSKPEGELRLELTDIPTEVLAEELASRLEGMPGNPLHDVFYRRGFHLLRKHFYLPIPDDTDRLDYFWGKPSALPGLDMNDDVALRMMKNVFPPFLDEFRKRFPLYKKEGADPGFYLINGGYMAVDAHVYYCLIRQNRPRRILEIGVGNSTLLAIAANAYNEQDGRRACLTSVDPYPWELFRGGYPGLDELIDRRVQEVPLSTFEALEADDILFIDSSHVIRSGNDVHFEFLEVLPRLKPGVLVHVHDVSLPKPYPKVYFDNNLYWNEQYVLQAFLAFNDRFEVIWPGNYMMVTYPERMLETFPEMLTMREHYPQSEPTAFWMRVKN
jgi:glycosyltransferase involved in cell wall biosynthesis